MRASSLASAYKRSAPAPGPDGELSRSDARIAAAVASSSALAHASALSFVSKR
jgi:hypothetical protein